jgi:hypothetical protein
VFRRYRSEILITLAALAIAAAWLPIRMRFPFDDTYITFRYAANLAHGFGIVWNPGGAHTEGCTNFLFMLMLVPFSWMGCDLVVVSQAIGVGAVVVSAIAIYRIVEAYGNAPFGGNAPTSINGRIALRPYGVFAVALFLLDPFTWLNAYSGMETSLFTMWLLLAVCSTEPFGRLRAGSLGPLQSSLNLKVRCYTPFIFATLAALTRPEGVLIGVAIVIVASWPFSKETPVTEKVFWSFESFRSFLRPAFYCFILPLMIYALWKLWYFGGLLPNSFYIKVSQASGATFLPGRGAMGIFYGGVWYLLLLALVAAWIDRGRSRGRKNAVVQIALLWCILLSFFYLFSHLISNEYQRFTNSIEVMLIVLAAIAFRYSRITNLLRTKNRNDRSNVQRTVPPMWIQYFAMAVVLAYHIHTTLYFRGGLGYIQREDEYMSRYSRVAPVLRSIPDHEHITLAWGDAGRLPYMSELRNIDPVGLNTNEIARAHTTQEVVNFIIRSKPDMIVIPLSLPSDINDTCYTVLRGGDGLIGGKDLSGVFGYQALAAETIASTYKAIAMIPQTVYDLDIFVDTLSPHYRDIVNTLVPRIGHDSDFLAPARCVK